MNNKPCTHMWISYPGGIVICLRWVITSVSEQPSFRHCHICFRRESVTAELCTTAVIMPSGEPIKSNQDIQSPSITINNTGPYIGGGGGYHFQHFFSHPFWHTFKGPLIEIEILTVALYFLLHNFLNSIPHL